MTNETKFPTGWTMYAIGQIGEVIGGGTPPTEIKEYYTGDIPWITPKDLSGYTNTYIEKGSRNITKQGLDNSSARLLPKGAVLFTSRAPIGYVAIANTEVTTNQGFKSIICNEKAHNVFLYYWLKNNKEKIEGFASGSTFKEISGGVLKDIEIILPPLPEQHAIAQILSDLDAKIELNRQMNSTLEKMAETLFKRWFVDFEFPDENGKPYKSSGGKMAGSELGVIPEGWKVGNIYALAEVVYGAPFSSQLFNKNKKGLPLIRIRDLKDASPEFYTTEEHPKASIINTGDIVAGMDAEFRPYIWLGEKSYLNQRLCYFKPKNGIHKYFILITIRPLLRFFENAKVGTTVIHLGKSDIDTWRVVIPNNELNDVFSKRIDGIFNQIVINSIENRSLISIRDSLLPKLMSGEIRVKPKGEKT